MNNNNRRLKWNFLKRYLFNGTVVTLFISLILHMFILSTHFKIFSQKHLDKKTEKKIRIVLREVKPEEVKKDQADDKKRQIVNTEQTGRKEVPKDGRFSGKRNQEFDRQVKARTVGSFKKAGLGKKDGRKMPKVLASSPKKVVQVKKKTTRKKGFRKKITLSDLALRPLNVPDKPPIKKLSLSALGVSKGEKKLSGLSQSNDFIEDVKLGDVTNLNTKEDKYFGFYDRIRKKLEQYWGDSLRQKAQVLYKSGRRFPANENMITSLQVTIDRKGNIVKVHIRSTSGIKELDNAAVESFNRAGPFPNPPRGLVKGGNAVIEWGFVVKV